MNGLGHLNLLSSTSMALHQQRLQVRAVPSETSAVSERDLKSQAVHQEVETSVESIGNKRSLQPTGNSKESDSSNKDGQYTESELDMLQQLKARDREVRAHEAAHAAVGGQYAGTPSYSYQRGPDGRPYAIGGEVQISLSNIADDPEATIRKMDIVRRAAMAPADPSGQDRQVAQEALSKKQVAQIEASQLDKEETFNENEMKAKGIEEDKNNTEPPSSNESATESMPLKSKAEQLFDLSPSNQSTFSTIA